jgi:deoxycytidylate deaminase
VGELLGNQTIQRGLKAAQKAALCSTGYHRVGAAVFKGKRMLSVGHNKPKTHPDSTTVQYGHHAEFACFIATYKYDLAGATIFVVRLTRGGRLGISKPCKECWSWIRAMGIKKVVYLDRNGNPVEERVAA